MPTRKSCWRLAITLLALGSASVSAQPSPQNAKRLLLECMTAKTTTQDQVALTRWMFANLASSDNVSDSAAISPKMRQSIDQKAANVFARLLRKDCRELAEPVVGTDAGLYSMVDPLGGQAIFAMFADPKVRGAAGRFFGYIQPEDSTTQTQ